MGALLAMGTLQPTTATTDPPILAKIGIAIVNHLSVVLQFSGCQEPWENSVSGATVQN